MVRDHDTGEETRPEAYVPQRSTYRVIDPAVVERLLAEGATIKMVAGVLGVSVQTFYRRLKQDPALAEAVEYGPSRGDAELLLAQYRSARKGNVKMLQFLGVNRLGQSHRPDPKLVREQYKLDVFTALGVNPTLLSDEDIETLLAIVTKGRADQTGDTKE